MSQSRQTKPTGPKAYRGPNLIIPPAAAPSVSGGHAQKHIKQVNQQRVAVPGPPAPRIGMKGRNPALRDPEETRYDDDDPPQPAQKVPRIVVIGTPASCGGQAQKQQPKHTLMSVMNMVPRPDTFDPAKKLRDFWPEKIHQADSLKLSTLRNTMECRQELVLPLARIKRIMRLDEDVQNQMISAEAPFLFSKACEIFIEELTLRAWIHTNENKRKTLQKNDISMAVAKNEMFDFLIDIVPREEMPPPMQTVSFPTPTKTSIQRVKRSPARDDIQSLVNSSFSILGGNEVLSSSGQGTSGEGSSGQQQLFIQLPSQYQSHMFQSDYPEEGSGIKIQQGSSKQSGGQVIQLGQPIPIQVQPGSSFITLCPEGQGKQQKLPLIVQPSTSK